ncbi:MAG: hypothetical protein WCR01_14395 [Bacteroidota bacterium]
MSQPRLLGRDASDQAIAVDINHQMYIIDNEKTPTDSFQLVYHFLDSTGWGKRILQNNRFGFYNNSLRLFNSSVYLMQKRQDKQEYPISTSILFSKLTIKTGIHDIKRDETVNIYPVPFSDLLTIDLTYTKITEITILLKDYLGRTVYNIFKGKTIPGKMKFYLNALDIKDQLVPATIYFVSIQMGDKIINQKALYMPDSARGVNCH